MKGTDEMILIFPMGIETLMNSGIMEVFIGTGVRGDTHAAVYRVFHPPVLGSHSLRAAAAADAGPGEKTGATADGVL